MFPGNTEVAIVLYFIAFILSVFSFLAYVENRITKKTLEISIWIHIIVLLGYMLLTF